MCTGFDGNCSTSLSVPIFNEIIRGLLSTLISLAIEYCTIFKTLLLVYKFQHSGYPKYFVPFLKPRHSVYNTSKKPS